MSDVSPESNQDSNQDSRTETSTATSTPAGPSISERANDFMSQTNEILSKVDWSQMGKYGKAVGIIAVVVIAQILIKVVVDTVNFFPILPGLLELLGIVVVGQWSWQNLTTSEKRNAVLEKVQNIRKEYID